MSRHELPFEPQRDLWTCGPAALNMVYRSFGRSDSQDAIWDRTGTREPSGLKYTRTNRLAADALERGFAALVVQARDHWLLLDRCGAADVRVIVQQPVDGGRRVGGHFSVLHSITEAGVVLHDPLEGILNLDRDQFFRRWARDVTYSGRVGSVLVAITPEPVDCAPCLLCGSIVPPQCRCDGCRRPVLLKPNTILGCPQKGCPMRAFARLFCPWCDQELSSLGPTLDVVCAGQPS